MPQLFAALLMLLALATPAHASDRCTAPAQVQAMTEAIASGVNASRSGQGLPDLRLSPRLSQAALKHACDMSVARFFGHKGSDGSNLQVRVRRTGYTDCLVAENIAWGYPRPAQIITGWMNSPGHRSNMLHPRALDMGIGITTGDKGPNWVLVVAKPC